MAGTGDDVATTLQSLQRVLATQGVKATLQAAWAEYDNFIITNSGTVRTAESFLRLLIFCLPGRYGDSEFKSEALQTLLTFVSFYHDMVVVRHYSGENAVNIGLLEPSVRDSIRAHVSIPEKCRKGATLLSIIRSAEVMLEMGGFQYGGKTGKWVIIVLVELVKAGIRAVLLRALKGSVVTCQSLPPVNRPSSEALNMPATVTSRTSTTTHGRTLNNLAPFDECVGDVYRLTPNALLYRAESRALANLSPEDRMAVTDTGQDAPKPTPPTPERYWGEVLYIIRPLVYVGGVLVMRKRKSWVPWVLSLVCEAASRYLIGDISRLNEVEQQEIHRRMIGFAFYLIRSPFFEAFTRNPAIAVLRFIGRLPLTSFLADNAGDLLAVLQRHYFYTANS